MSGAKRKQKKNARQKASASKRSAYVRQLRTEVDMFHLVGELLGDPSMHSRASAMNLVAAATAAGHLKAESPNPRYEGSSWMREAVSKAVERAETEAEEIGADPTAALYAYLGDYRFDEVVGHDEEFTCDRCRTFCPEGLLNGQMVTPTPSGRWLVLDLGLCDACYAREVAA